jgi:nickel-type superoxide dismutase maturation protease
MERMPPPSDDEGSPETYHQGRNRRKALATGLAVGLGIVYASIRWRPLRVEVQGPSMGPTLQAGDWALAVPASRYRVGDVVVVEHPKRRGFEMVKRIVAAPGDLAPDGRGLAPDEWWVEGDGPEASTDSRAFGPVSRRALRGRVRLVYWPPERRRLL